ncbi:hypothetical protein [Thermococcus sp.]|uniref:hypothetical protein n=1 Tax=Thermococcus sp. TaxID=35749 RepID=UPI0026142515|nr:hypothetical protein [Thermococcus sp.]
MAEDEVIPVAGVFVVNGVFTAAHIPYLQLENGDKEAWRWVRDSLLELAKDISKNWLGEDTLVWLSKKLEEERGGGE